MELKATTTTFVRIGCKLISTPAPREAQARRAPRFADVFIFIFSDFCQIYYLDIHRNDIYRIEFAGTVELWLSISDLELAFRSLEGRCRGNQFCANCADSTREIR